MKYYVTEFDHLLLEIIPWTDSRQDLRLIYSFFFIFFFIFILHFSPEQESVFHFSQRTSYWGSLRLTFSWEKTRRSFMSLAISSRESMPRLEDMVEEEKLEEELEDIDTCEGETRKRRAIRRKKRKISGWRNKSNKCNVIILIMRTTIRKNQRRKSRVPPRNIFRYIIN